jgi:hypothetical protein
MYARLGPRRFAAVVGGTAAFVGALIGVQRITGCGEDPPRIPLVDETVAGQRWLRHPRFAFHHPPADFVADPKVVELIEIRASRCYAYTRGDVDSLVVCTIDQPVASRDAWHRQVGAAQSGIARAIAGNRPMLASLYNGPAHTPVAKDIGWDDAAGTGTAFLHHVIEGISVRVKLFTISGGVAFMLATARADDLAGVVASFDRR